MTYDDLIEAGRTAELDKALADSWAKAGEAHDAEKAQADPDPEPPIEEKARIIAGDNREEYPVHWNDEVAEAFLALKEEHRLDLVLLQQRFEERLQDIAGERDGKQLLQVALPILVKMVENNRVMAQSEEVLVNGALDLARGLLVGCGLRVPR